MGKVEKIVVLSVLFLIVVILAVSQGGWGSDDVQARDRDDGQLAQGDTPDRRVDRISTPLPDIDDPRGMLPVVDDTPGLLSTVVHGDQESADVDPELIAPALDPAWDLITLSGLRSTFDPDYKVYTCGRNDTFESVALALYGDEDLARLLRHANEGVTTLAYEQRLLAPVQDDGLAGVNTYTVQEGESLWILAKKFYGAGHRWNEIYEANRDVLKSPDSVRTGLLLRIP